MNILKNPLYLLNASIRDDKSVLVDLAEDYLLLNDDEEGHTYANDLTSPRRRLGIEIAWLLGVSETLNGAFIDKIEDFKFVREATHLNPLAKANLLSSSMEQQSSICKEDSVELVLSLSLAASKIEADEVQTLINQERLHSKFVSVDSIQNVELELEGRKKFYKDAAINLLDKLSSIDLVETITTIVERDTDKGESYCTGLVKDVISFYEVKAQNFLDLEEENIDKIIDIIYEDLKNDCSQQLISIHMSELIRVVKNWDLVAQPIQLLTMSQGIPHEKSNKLAHKIRELNLKLFERDHVELTQQLTYELIEIFAEDHGFKERAKKDLNDIADIIDSRVRSEQDERRFAEEITYKVDIGLAFKNEFFINPEIIEWKNRSILISDITKVRWGAVKSNYGTEYRIYYGNDSKLEEVVTRKSQVFSKIIDRIWKTAGLNIMFQYLALLQDDDQIDLGNTIIKDHGMVLARHKLLGKNEYELVGWSQIQMQAYNGNLVISKTGDPKMNCVLSYLDGNNVHIIESMINMTMTSSCIRLSDTLKRR